MGCTMPDLNPMDFYLWGHLKSFVYSTPVTNINVPREHDLIKSETHQDFTREYGEAWNAGSGDASKQEEVTSNNLHI